MSSGPIFSSCSNEKLRKVIYVPLPNRGKLVMQLCLLQLFKNACNFCLHDFQIHCTTKLQSLNSVPQHPALQIGNSSIQPHNPEIKKYKRLVLFYMKTPCIIVKHILEPAQSSSLTQFLIKWFPKIVLIYWIHSLYH